MTPPQGEVAPELDWYRQAGQVSDRQWRDPASPGDRATVPCAGATIGVVGADRIVSLVPSMTETLIAWGVEPVACTRFCEQPALRTVGGTKDPDVDAIVALEPDLVIVDAEENRREDHDALARAGVPLHVLRIRDVRDVDVQLAPLAAALGREIEPIGIREPPPVTRRAFVPIWKRPWMALGTPTYGTSLLGVLGIASVHAGEGPYPATSIRDAASRGPDLVIAPSEPYPFGERHRAELEQVAPTVFVDGRDLVWWGSRTRSALDRLAAHLGT